VNAELAKLNFNDLLRFDSAVDLAGYAFNAYMRNGGQHLVKGYCLRCESKGCNTCPTDPDFKLTNISHGASTDDFLQATNQDKTDLSGWHNEGVLFLMESPSKNYDLYTEVEFNGHKKKPTTQWYWVHEEHEAYHYPEQFKGGVYGPLINSIIFTFKLGNAYLTNLVKCGLNNTDEDYKRLNEYNQDAVTTCYDAFLVREIAIVQPKVIFCFGSKVYDFLWQQYANAPFPWRVMPLPHPARAQMGFRRDLYRHSYYSMILEGLFEAGIITIDEAKERYGEFLKLSNRHNG